MGRLVGLPPAWTVGIYNLVRLLSDRHGPYGPVEAEGRETPNDEIAAMI